MVIFTTYTGNAMLNNALMTIEALAKLSSVSEITPKVLLRLYGKVQLKEINKRLKSYTMVFSLNNPLVNPAKKTNNAGENTYHQLLNAIMNEFENEGKYTCEISGMKFNKTFEDFYKEEIDRQKNILVKESKDAKQLNKELKNLENTDTSLNRSWFPLIGGLGSDAQALPQAKFTVQIHPICIPILQFLPLSALLYKGGILLVDSSNFDLARAMVFKNAKTLAEKIEAVSVKESIENVRDYAKGDYLIRVLDTLSEKEEFEETYSDLNMWSFSNSGTGASCEIDRVPNRLIKKLQILYKNPKTGNELKGILSRNESAYSFIECLEDNKDWFLLYPNVSGSGKKKVEYDGVSPDFLEAYYKAISQTKSIEYAKYIAGLIDKYKSVAFEKFLPKTDAWNEPEYRIELYKALVWATEEGEWSLQHQIRILDNNDTIPVKNYYFQIHKLVHYYYQKKIIGANIPPANVDSTSVFKACKWMIGIIQNDFNSSTISNLANPNEYLKVGFDRMIIEAVETNRIEIENVLETFYDENFSYSKFGLNELLRIFFSQPIQENYSIENWKSELKENVLIQNWTKTIDEFTEDYKNYYCDKYRHRETLALPVKKFAKTVRFIANEHEGFYTLLNEAIYNVNQYLIENKLFNGDKWSTSALLCNPLGIYSTSISMIAIKFLLKIKSIKLTKENELINNN